jgi:hypothetical protein
MIRNDQGLPFNPPAHRLRMVVQLLVALVLAGSLVGGVLWAFSSVQADGPEIVAVDGDLVGGDLDIKTHTGESRFIEVVQLVSSLGLSVTVGTDASVCALTDAITIESDTAVTYCYEVTNTGLTTLTRHDLEDSQLGVILKGFPYSLIPGASAFLTQTVWITQSVVNSATWTAYNPGPVDVVSATDSALVTVVPPSIALTKTVGTDASVCALTDAITVEPDTAVTYCYEVTNTGLTTLTRHDLEDSQLGVILDGLPYSLIPGVSAFLTQTVWITQSVVNSATWTAYNPGPVDVVSATDSATVTVITKVYLPLVLSED